VIERKRLSLLLASMLAILTIPPAAHSQSTAPNGFVIVQNPLGTAAPNRPAAGLSGPQVQLGSPESRPDGGLIARSVRRFGEDQKNVFSAPFHVRNFKWDALFLGGTAALVAADESASRHLPTTSAYISRNISNATIFGTAAIVGSTWIYGLKTHNEHAKETGELTLEAMANAFTVYAATQIIAGRERPYEGTGEGSFFKHHSVNTAFPGGHAMFTFAMAGIVAHEYPHPLVKILAYGAASAVAASRFTARQHFLSDVAVGSALGYLISREIFYSRCKVGLGSACHHHPED